jgi:hypothetical protein
MPMHSRRLRLSLMIATAASAVLAARAGAAMIDYDRTAGGGQQLFSVLVRDTPVPWELFADEHVTPSTGSDSDNPLASPGLRSPDVAESDLGEVLVYSGADGRDRRIIFDVYATLPVAKIFYLDPTDSLNSTPTISGAAGSESVSIGGAPDVGSSAAAAAPAFFLAGPPATIPIQVPEPASATLLLASATGLLLRRTRHG